MIVGCVGGVRDGARGSRWNGQWERNNRKWSCCIVAWDNVCPSVVGYWCVHTQDTNMQKTIEITKDLQPNKPYCCRCLARVPLDPWPPILSWTPTSLRLYVDDDTSGVNAPAFIYTAPPWRIFRTRMLPGQAMPCIAPTKSTLSRTSEVELLIPLCRCWIRWAGRTGYISSGMPSPRRK